MPGSTRALIIGAVAVLLLSYGVYAAAVTIPNGNPTKRASIMASVEPDGRMYFRCDAANSTPGACRDEGGHATVSASKRDRVTIRVSTDDGRRHSHDFKLEGAAYAIWPAGIEMELEKPAQEKTFTAWSAGTYRFVCELPGHEERGMWGTLHVE